MMVAADPMSIAIESETRFLRAAMLMNAAVLLSNDMRLSYGFLRKELRKELLCRFAAVSLHALVMPSYSINPSQRGEVNPESAGHRSKASKLGSTLGNCI